MGATTTSLSPRRAPERPSSHALDYRRLCGSDERDERPSLLFVAHRREIPGTVAPHVTARCSLKPSLRRGVRRSARPERWRHVFASSSPSPRTASGTSREDAFDVVVIDEFHHASGDRRTGKILDRLEPKQLLGLTATPERPTACDVRGCCLRRAASLLSCACGTRSGKICCARIHYFGIADNVRPHAVAWTRVGYDETQLANALHRQLRPRRHRDQAVARQSRRRGADCAHSASAFRSKLHGNYMARVFNEAGIRLLPSPA